MYVRNEARARSACRFWQRARGWRRMGVLVCILSASLLSGCGASSASTPATLAQPQPTSVVVRPLHTTTRTFDGDFVITLDITPNHSGPNHFSALVTDTRTGKPAAVPITITLYTTMQDMPMGTDSVVLQAEGGGLFSATSPVLSMGGHWALGILIQTADHAMHKAGVSFVVPF